MKDEGLSIDVQFLKQLPLPTPPPGLRLDISSLAAALVTNATSTMREDKIAVLELQLNELVERAFGLTDTQRDVMLSSLPPRDPIADIQHDAQEARLAAAG
jgi:hypothetical protein